MGKKISVKNIKFIDSALMNDATYFDYLERMKKIALSMFEWVDLPTGMNQRYIEECLYYKGMASLLKDEDLGYINTQCCSNGQINIYGLPTSLNCYSFNYQTDRLLYTGLLYDENGIDITDRNKYCILVMNTWEKVPTASTIELFAQRLTEAERTCDTNIKSQKFPVLISCEDNQRLTMENLYSQYDGNQPFIFGNKNSSINPDSLKSIKTDAPYIADKLTQYKKDIWNEFLTFMGINNIDSEKKERMVADEVNQNNEVINMNLQAHLVPRQEACKQFNELFGTNISVRVRSDLHNVIKNVQSIVKDYKEDIDKEGEDNE